MHIINDDLAPAPETAERANFSLQNSRNAPASRVPAFSGTGRQFDSTFSGHNAGISSFLLTRFPSKFTEQVVIFFRFVSPCSFLRLELHE